MVGSFMVAGVSSWASSLLVLADQKAESSQGLGTDYKTSVFNLKDPLPPVEV